MRRLFSLFVIVVLVFAVTGHGKLPQVLSVEQLKPFKQPGVILLAVLVAWLLGYLVGRFRTHSFQNRGEAKVSRALTKRFPAPDYFLMNHVTLQVGGGTAQIDHILISRFGIFVIETKDYSGWIFGSADDRKWTAVYYRLKFRFQNPLRQNSGHVRAIQNLLEFLPANAIRSVVVFAGSGRFKTRVPEGVFDLSGLLAHIEGHITEVMSLNRVQFCVGRIETARRSVSKATDVEHIQRLRRKYGIRD